jgi:hypothetical protein
MREMRKMREMVRTHDSPLAISPAISHEYSNEVHQLGAFKALRLFRSTL